MVDLLLVEDGGGDEGAEPDRGPEEDRIAGTGAGLADERALPRDCGAPVGVLHRAA